LLCATHLTDAFISVTGTEASSAQFLESFRQKRLEVELRRLGRRMDPGRPSRWVDVVLLVATGEWTAGAIELAQAPRRPQCILIEPEDGALVAVPTSSALRDGDLELAALLSLPNTYYDEE
jgi:hypothetical protein